MKKKLKKQNDFEILQTTPIESVIEKDINNTEIEKISINSQKTGSTKSLKKNKKVNLQYLQPIIDESESDMVLDVETTQKSFLFCNAGDIETILFKGQHFVAAFAVKFEKFYFVEFLEANIKRVDEWDCDSLLNASNSVILTLLDKVFNSMSTHKLNIFFHNMSNFDGVFIINACVKKYNPQIIMRNNIIYEIVLTWEMKSIHLRDSYHIIPFSLEKAGEIINFNKKPWDYSTNIIENLYDDKYLKKLLNYLNNDVLVLYKIIDTYVKIYTDIIGEFQGYTIPSIALTLYRKNFYKEACIAKLKPGVDAIIRKGYLGGICEIYKPTSKNKIYYYDVNSLYPHVMAKYEYPIGIANYVEGSKINLHGETPFFGFLWCFVKTPKKMYIPLISIKSENGLIQPLGKFKALLFSKEAEFAIKNGYVIKPIYGYSFERGHIFKEYVETLLSERQKHAKNSCENMVIKLLLNSLYGKFGMHLEHVVTTIIPFDDIKNYRKYYKIIFCEPLTMDPESDMFIISYEKGINKEILTDSLLKNKITYKEREEFENKEKFHFLLTNTAVHIAAAITAYARIEINTYKLKYQKSLLYSDTDSLFLDEPMEDSLIDSKKLGMFKLEGVYDSAFFIAPKVYALFKDKDSLNNTQEEVKITMKGLSKEVKRDYKSILENKDFWKKCLNKNIEPLKTFLKRTFIRDIKTMTVKYNLIPQNITFSLNYNKRMKKYNSKNLWYDTEPITIIDEKKNR